MASIQGIYLALFGRPADPAGLAYWNEQSKNGADLSKIIEVMTKAPEAVARFSGLSDAALVTGIYQALFDRAPDAAGLAFFTEQLKSGKQTVGSLAINILDGAGGNDLILVQNREKAANAFTASLDTPAEVAAYSGSAAADFGRSFVKTVTTDPASIPTADKIQASINTSLPGASSGQAPAGGQTPAAGGSTGGGSTDPGTTNPQPTTVTLDKTFSQDFSGSVSGAWTVDRKAPAGFETAIVGGRTVLKETINESQRSTNTFENTQGKKLDVPTGTKTVSIDLFVPQEWSANDNVRHAGFWGTTANSTGAVSGYPIIEFHDGKFRVWDSDAPGGWTVIGLPSNFQFNAWQTLKMELLASGNFKYTVGDLVAEVTIQPGSVEISNVILQGYNFNFGQTTTTADAEQYDILWDTLNTGPTVYVESSRDLTGFDNVLSTNSNVFIKDTATLKVDASKVAALNFVGDGALHLTNASSYDSSAKKLAVIVEGNGSNGIFIGGKANDSIDGGGGNDVIKGGAGDDVLKGGTGNDLIWGDLPHVTETVATNYGDDTINGGLGTNLIVLGTQAQDIQLGGQDTVQVIRGQQGDDVIFNFNFGPTNRYDDIRAGQSGTDVAASAPGADKTFDILKVSGYSSLEDFQANVTVKIGNANTAYTDKVNTVLGTGATISGNIITTTNGDIYSGPSSGGEFEIVFEFANGGSVTFANAMSRWEKFGFLKQLNPQFAQGATSPSTGGVDEDNALRGLTYANGTDPTSGLVTLTDVQEAALVGLLQSQGNFMLA